MRKVVVAALLCCLSTPAWAACYDVSGCSERNRFRLDDLLNGPNCQFLDTMRNGIYQERGYCFKTKRAIAAFGNSGCRHDNMRDVPLNGVERHNVARIAEAERIKGCLR